MSKNYGYSTEESFLKNRPIYYRRYYSIFDSQLINKLVSIDHLIKFGKIDRKKERDLKNDRKKILDDIKSYETNFMMAKCMYIIAKTSDLNIDDHEIVKEIGIQLWKNHTPKTIVPYLTKILSSYPGIDPDDSILDEIISSM